MIKKESPTQDGRPQSFPILGSQGQRMSSKQAQYFNQLQIHANTILISVLSQVGRQLDLKHQECIQSLQELAVDLYSNSSIMSFGQVHEEPSHKSSNRNKHPSQNQFSQSHSLDSQSHIELSRSKSVNFKSKALRGLSILKKNKTESDQPNPDE